MNQIQTFQKLVDLLGHSENDPELQALFIELGEKFPLKRPKSDETGYLLEDYKKKQRDFNEDKLKEVAIERGHDEAALKGPAIGKMSALTKVVLLLMVVGLFFFSFIHLSNKSLKSIIQNPARLFSVEEVRHLDELAIKQVEINENSPS